jgi:hypothetical protein
VPIKRSPGCGCCGVPTFTCAALSCNIPATIYVTDPVYGVTATLTKTGSTWNGNATISFPGYFVNSSCSAQSATLGYIFDCTGTGTLKVQCSQNFSCPFPGTPNFGSTGVITPMSAGRLSFTCSSPGVFSAVYAGFTNASGDLILINLFQVPNDGASRQWNFAMSS